LPAVLDPFSLQDGFQWDTCKQVPKQVKVDSPELQGWNSVALIDPSSQDPELHCLMTTAANSKHSQPVLPFL